MNKRFRVAFTFAGEKRDFVAKVARILADRFGESRILYDKYHEAEFARIDLAFHLPNLYNQEADLIVAVLCHDYRNKEWCGLEWNALYGLIKKRDYKEVMLTRFDRVEGQGLYGLAGFLDLDDRSAEDTAALIVQRLEINDGAQGAELADQPVSGDWPEVAPALEWPVADHTEARLAFAKLITRAAPFRLLPICGRSDTGKSHLTKQFLRNALPIPKLTCGRFDFKGSSDMDGELSRFAEQLEVPVKGGGGVSNQLAQILASLRDAARPTLLIFDTFEMAGEAERWVKESLLLTMVRASWLRVIIVGQRVTKSHGEPWSGFTSAPIELLPPSPQEWFDFGCLHKDNLTLEIVCKVHELAGGKSSMLAQLFGPSS